MAACVLSEKMLAAAAIRERCRVHAAVSLLLGDDDDDGGGSGGGGGGGSGGGGGGGGGGGNGNMRAAAFAAAIAVENAKSCARATRMQTRRRRAPLLLAHFLAYERHTLYLAARHCKILCCARARAARERCKSMRRPPAY